MMPVINARFANWSPVSHSGVAGASGIEDRASLPALIYLRLDDSL